MVFAVEDGQEGDQDQGGEDGAEGGDDGSGQVGDP